MTREEFDSYIDSANNSDEEWVFVNKYIDSLEATIEAQKIIIKDKTEIIESMAQPNACTQCFYSDNDKCSKLQFILPHRPELFCCSHFEPKAQ